MLIRVKAVSLTLLDRTLLSAHTHANLTSLSQLTNDFSTKSSLEIGFDVAGVVEKVNSIECPFVAGDEVVGMIPLNSVAIGGAGLRQFICQNWFNFGKEEEEERRRE
jgi:NADPH:quinone reductase-like Zn-dependent oxidoreductase